jgi:hypothetical protein
MENEDLFNSIVDLEMRLQAALAVLKQVCAQTGVAFPKELEEPEEAE